MGRALTTGYQTCSFLLVRKFHHRISLHHAVAFTELHLHLSKSILAKGYIHGFLKLHTMVDVVITDWWLDSFYVGWLGGNFCFQC